MCDLVCVQLAKVRSFEIDRMKAAMEDTGSTAANLTISARSPPQAASASRRRNSLTGTSPARRASITGSTAGGSVANTALLAHLSPKDVDAFLRGDALPSESKGDFLMAGRGVGGGRRGSFASPPPVPESATEGEGPVSGERRRSIAEVHYGHIGPKVETRRASVVAGSTAAPDTEAPASPPKPLLKAGELPCCGVRQLCVGVRLAFPFVRVTHAAVCQGLFCGMLPLAVRMSA